MTADPERLQGKQLVAYRIVREHFEDKSAEKQPLRMIVSGTAGTGKSYLTQCLRLLLGDTLKVTAPTGAAAFIVDGTHCCVFQSRVSSKSSWLTACRQYRNSFQSSNT